MNPLVLVVGAAETISGTGRRWLVHRELLRRHGPWRHPGTLVAKAVQTSDWRPCGGCRRDVPLPRGLLLNSDKATVNPIKVKTTVDEATAAAIPAFRSLLGKRVELIALQAEADPAESTEPRLTLDELLARRIDAPTGAAPLTDEDIQRAIMQGALDGSI